MEPALSTLQRWLARADDALTSRRRWLVILFAAAFVLKLVYIIQSAEALHVRVPVMDSQYYDETARDIAAGRVLRREAFFMGPLYPYFLSLVYLLFGRDFMIVRFLQIIGGAASVVLTFVIGRQVFRPSAAFLGAVFLMLYGTMAFYEGLLLMTWMGTLLNLGVLAVLYRARRSPEGVSRYALAGFLLGLSALARANVLVFLPVALVWILWIVRERRRVAQAAAFALAAFLTLLPASIHNYAASRDLVLVTSNAGLNFFIGNNAVATGIFYPLPEIDFVRDPTSRTYIERMLGKDLSPSEVSRYWFQRSMDYIREHPAGELRLLARKFALFFSGYEIPQIESYALERDQYASLRVFFVDFWWLLSLGATGILFSLREWRRHFLVSGFVAVYALSVIAFFITARYRVQITPMLALFAAHAVVTVAPRFLGSARRGFAFVGTLALLLALTHPGVFAMEEREVSYRQHVHNARRLSELGEHKPAIEEIDKAIALYPDFYEGYWQRAIINIAANDQLKAAEDYSRALSHKSDVPTIHYDFAQTLRRLNMTDKAISEYETAIDLDPVMVEAHNNLGIAYREAGRYEDAIRAFARVIELDPRYAKAYNNLGACLAESGREDQAIVTFRRATQLFPGYANSYKNLAMAYVSVKRPRPALDAIEAYLALRPDDDGARDLMEKLQVAVAADSVGGE
jgi:tetratricopeptide (TPR) repeat protein